MSLSHRKLTGLTVGQILFVIFISSLVPRRMLAQRDAAEIIAIRQRISNVEADFSSLSWNCVYADTNVKFEGKVCRGEGGYLIEGYLTEEGSRETYVEYFLSRSGEVVKVNRARLLAFIGMQDTMYCPPVCPSNGWTELIGRRGDAWLPGGGADSEEMRYEIKDLRGEVQLTRVAKPKNGLIINYSDQSWLPTHYETFSDDSMDPNLLGDLIWVDFGSAVVLKSVSETITESGVGSFKRRIIENSFIEPTESLGYNSVQEFVNSLGTGFLVKRVGSDRKISSGEIIGTGRKVLTRKLLLNGIKLREVYGR
jgi:hypothetical protein